MQILSMTTKRTTWCKWATKISIHATQKLRWTYTRVAGTRSPCGSPAICSTFAPSTATARPARRSTSGSSHLLLLLPLHRNRHLAQVPVLLQLSLQLTHRNHLARVPLLALQLLLITRRNHLAQVQVPLQLFLINLRIPLHLRLPRLKIVLPRPCHPRACCFLSSFSRLWVSLHIIFSMYFCMGRICWKLFYENLSFLRFEYFNFSSIFLITIYPTLKSCEFFVCFISIYFALILD
jgi:hypothetical protein